MRLQRAWKMITATAMTAGPLPFSEIAFRSGFVDQSTFNRMFKRRYGITPREARSLYN
jgi:AraC-like DNA-binding protein